MDFELVLTIAALPTESALESFKPFAQDETTAHRQLAKSDRMHGPKWGVNSLKAHVKACHGFHGPVSAVNSGFSVLKVYRRPAGWQG